MEKPKLDGALDRNLSQTYVIVGQLNGHLVGQIEHN
jgi:hypothetical protein